MTNKAKLNRIRIQRCLRKIRNGQPVVVTVAKAFPLLYTQNEIGFRIMVQQVQETLEVKRGLIVNGE